MIQNTVIQAVAPPGNPHAVVGRAAADGETPFMEIVKSTKHMARGGCLVNICPINNQVFSFVELGS